MRASYLILYTIVFQLLMSSAVFAEEPSLVRSSGKVILELEIEGVHISSDELRALIPFSEGSQLRPELVRQGVVNFYRTGLYERVEVLLRDSLGGVAVKYTLYPKKWLEKIEFTGNLYLDDRKLLSKVNLRSNEEISDEKLISNVERISEYYRFRGFTGSEITHRIAADEQNRTKIFFMIREGDRQYISDVRLTGNAGISRTKLLSIIASMPGSRLDGEDLEADTIKVRQFLRKKLYLTPALAYTVRPDTRFPGGSVVTFDIDKGPVFRLQVLMDDAKESKKLAKKMRSVFIKSTTPETAKLSIKAHVLNRYLKMGYPFTAVDLQDHRDENGNRIVTLEIDKGLNAVTEDLRVEGGQFFAEDRLNNILGIVPGEPFVKTELEEGIENLQKEYRQEGFLSTTVSRQPLNFLPKDGFQEAMISLNVQEGPRNLIRNLHVVDSPIQTKRTSELIGIGAGDPYVPEMIDKGRDDLLQELGSMGYLYASVSVAEPDINPDNTVDLVVTVREGPKVRLGTVIISGNELVKAQIIRVVLDLHRGEVLTRDKILKAQERIYGLKVMSTVDVQLADPLTPAAHKDLIVNVKERPKYVVGFRIGYGSEDKLRGEFSVTNRNFRQMARSVSLRAKSSDIERNTTLLYTHPRFKLLPIDMTLSLTDLYEERDSYSRDSLSLAVDFIRPLSDKTKVRAGYFFEGLELSDVSPDAHLSREEEGKTDIGAIVGEIVRDTRNDFLDPWSGVLSDLILEYAAKPLASKAEYYKAEIAAHRYINPFDDIVIAALLRLGRAKAYGENDEVVISKRFFLGGSNSVRGYALDSLGPRDSDGDPLGGNFMINANVEVRCPLYGSLRGVLFVDSGSVWRENALDPEDEKFHLRASSGAGLRWSSPLGPLSLDYGYKLNPVREDEDDRTRWHFSIGHAF